MIRRRNIEGLLACLIASVFIMVVVVTIPKQFESHDTGLIVSMLFAFVGGIVAAMIGIAVATR
jgi:membrane-associated HD superfamily phosphohydrolase